MLSSSYGVCKKNVCCHRFSLIIALQQVVKTGHDIWRFTFPYEEEKEPVIKHKCLTGNYFYWYLNDAKPVNNVSLPKGFYSYSVAPDGAVTSAFTFKEGRLTNRLAAPRAGDYFNWLNNELVKSGKLTWRNFADKWSKTDPLEIVVDFGKEVTVNEVKLFYNGDDEFDAERVYEGAIVPMTTTDNQIINAQVVEITDDQVTIDLNHPLAGETLHFVGKVIDVRDVTPGELKALHQRGQCGRCKGDCNSCESDCNNCDK